MKDSKLQLFTLLSLVLQTIIFAILLLCLFKSNQALIEQYESLSGHTHRQTANFVVQDSSSEQIRQLMREVIRDELLAAEIDPVTPDENSATLASFEQQRDTPPFNQSDWDKQQNAAINSKSILAQALSLGVWTQGSTQSLMMHLPDLSEQDRIALLDQFHQAVNRQELELEDFPPL